MKENHIIIKIQTGKRELLKDGELVLTMQTPPFLFRGKTFLSCSALAGRLIQKIELSEPITQTCAISKGILYTASGPALYAFGSAH